MYGIYANMTGFFVDGKCGSMIMAYIRIRHGYPMLVEVTIPLKNKPRPESTLATWPLHDRSATNFRRLESRPIVKVVPHFEFGKKQMSWV